MTRFALVVLGLIVIVQVALLGLAFADESDPIRLPTPIEPTGQLEFPLDFEGIWPFANDVAVRWRSDAQLVAATMQFDWPRDDSSTLAEMPLGGWIFLAFLSGEDLLTLRVDRGSGVIVDSRVLSLNAKARDSYAADAIDLDDASTRSGTAAVAAETAYGSAFRAECLDRRFQSWLAIRDDPSTGEAVWHIEYESVNEDGEPQPPLTLNVNWGNGEIENVTNADTSCL